jgi:anaerobic selenocysteine-containing dehydrogenase
MAITRREFLQYSAATGAGVLFGVFDLKPIVAYAASSAPVWTSEAFNICPYCGVGCGMIVGKNASGQITYVQGDPDNPHNLGSLCAKGQNAGQLNHIEGYAGPTAWYKAADSERVIYPLKRAPGASTWTQMTWNDALNEIANLIKNTRTVDADMKCTNIAVLGTAKATNEECYLLTKLMRSLGIVYFEHCARL